MNNFIVAVIIIIILLLVAIWIYWNRNREYAIKIQKIRITEFDDDDPDPDPKNNTKCIPKKEYVQVGILKNVDLDTEKLLFPLYAKKCKDRQRWQYYAVYDKYYLPVLFNNKDCQHLIGCEFIRTGDEIVIPEYANKVFKALIKKEYNC
jgi:hypothetical protein